MIRKLFSHTAIYGLAPHVSKFASFFVLPLVTQHLTAIDYGVYGVVTAAVGLISVLASLGLRLVLVNSFFKSPNHYKWQWRQIYGFLTIWSMPYTIVTSILLYLIVPGEASDNVWAIIALNVIPLIFFGQTSTIAMTYYQVNKKPMPIALRTITIGLLTIFLNWYTISILKMGYMGWFWSTFIAGIINNISFWIPLNIGLKITPIFNFKYRLLKQNLKVSLPTVPHYYSGYLLNTSDKLLMEFLKVDSASIGKYNVAYTFGNYFNTLGVASGLAVGPLLNECYKAGNEVKARSLIFIQQVIFLLLSFAICLWMKELFYFFIRNEELNKMYFLGVIIVMGYNYRPMYFGANAKLMYVEKTKLLWRVSFVAGILNVTLNLIFIPVFGYEAAAYTTYVSLLYMGYAGYFFKEFREHTKVAYHPLLWLLLTVVITMCAAVAVDFHWTIKALFSALSAMSGIVLIKRFNDQAKQS
jgi:O-antigen/teichoic acid export membrane protein